MNILKGKETSGQEKMLSNNVMFKNGKWNNLIIRCISGVILIGVFGISLMYVPVLQYFLIPLIGILMLLEWYDITHTSTAHLLLGLVIIPIPIISLMLICDIQNAFWIILTYSAIIISVDTFALLGGIILQGPKLAPKISPKKTWNGLIVGAVCAGLATKILSLLPHYSIPEYMLKYLTIGSLCFAVLSQMSDLFISFFKRRFNVKDSGSIIPGHGGVLDRFDGFILTAPTLLVIIKINGTFAILSHW